MMAFYAAVGRYRIKNENGHKVPYIQKLGKLYPISIPEFVIWSSLLWEVMTYPELEKQYQETVQELNPKCPTFDDMLLKLKERRLIMEGLGYTGLDALFNMLSDAFVVPYWVSLPRKVWTVVRLWLKGQISIVDIFRILKERNASEDEDRVIRLVEQTPLSTAELIRCFDRDIYDVSSAEKVIAGIYPDEESDQFHIANEERTSKHARKVLQAVANLYLNRKIVLEVV